MGHRSRHISIDHEHQCRVDHVLCAPHIAARVLLRVPGNDTVPLAAEPIVWICIQKIGCYSIYSYGRELNGQSAY